MIPDSDTVRKLLIRKIFIGMGMMQVLFLVLFFSFSKFYNCVPVNGFETAKEVKDFASFHLTRPDPSETNDIKTLEEIPMKVNSLDDSKNSKDNLNSSKQSCSSTSEKAIILPWCSKSDQYSLSNGSFEYQSDENGKKIELTESSASTMEKISKFFFKNQNQQYYYPKFLTEEQYNELEECNSSYLPETGRYCRVFDIYWQIIDPPKFTSFIGNEQNNVKISKSLNTRLEKLKEKLKNIPKDFKISLASNPKTSARYLTPFLMSGKKFAGLYQDEYVFFHFEHPDRKDNWKRLFEDAFVKARENQISDENSACFESYVCFYINYFEIIFEKIQPSENQKKWEFYFSEIKYLEDQAYFEKAILISKMHLDIKNQNFILSQLSPRQYNWYLETIFNRIFFYKDCKFLQSPIFSFQKLPTFSEKIYSFLNDYFDKKFAINNLNYDKNNDSHKNQQADTNFEYIEGFNLLLMVSEPPSNIDEFKKLSKYFHYGSSFALERFSENYFCKGQLLAHLTEIFKEANGDFEISLLKIMGELIFAYLPDIYVKKFHVEWEKAVIQNFQHHEYSKGIKFIRENLKEYI